MKKLDVLIVARPDHSIQIYNGLLGQSSLKFKYLSYKIFPKWVKRLTGYKKLTTVSRDAICSWRMTAVNLCRFKFRFRFAQKWDETRIFNHILRRLFRKYDIRIIHYWPEYGDEVIQQYANTHQGVRTFADIHMPHPMIVYKEMSPVYKKYGIDPESTQLAVMAREQSNFAGLATDILVPSSYVADTYRSVYEGKTYHVVSYGITVSESYEKCYRNIISEFVYAGRISLEKGSDLLLEYFAEHQDKNIHLFGDILNGQEFIFEPYRKYRNIYFHGSVPKVELQKYMKNYHVGIHLSRFDAYSLAVGEMIGCGLPVVISNCTGCLDDVQNEKMGLVCTLSKEDIEQTINKMCNPVIYNEFIDSINTYIKEKHKSFADKMLEFYKKNLDK